jgi:hypothetical protein
MDNIGKKMNDIDGILGELRATDLLTASREEIAAVVSRIDQTVLMGFTWLPGSYVIRARPHRTAECLTEWRNEEHISYLRDPSRIPPFNRASFEGDSMFYGCSGQADQFKETIHIAYNEISRMVNNPNYPLDEEYYIAGHWRVTEPINVIALVHHQEFIAKNERLRKMNEQYNAAVHRDQKMTDRSLRVVEFFADEFAKPVDIDEGYKYKISAAFATHVMNLGMDGIIYPSVKAKGDTSVFNVALKPQVVDTKLKLIEASVMRVIKLADGSVAPLPYMRDRNVVGNFRWEEYPEAYSRAQVEAELARRAQSGIPVPQLKQT